MTDQKSTRAVRSGTRPRDSPALSSGTQALAAASASAEPLTDLPERAYENLLVVSTRSHPRRIEKRLRSAGADLSNVGVVPVSPSAGGYDGEVWTTDSVRPDDLTGIGMRLTDAIRHLEPGAGWVVLDALGVLLMYVDESPAYRFVQTLAGRVRAHGACGVYCLDPDAVDERTYDRFRTLCDAELAFE